MDSDASDELRELAADLGVDFDTKGSAITDHFSRYNQQQPGIITSNTLDSSIIFGSSHKHVRAVPASMYFTSATQAQELTLAPASLAGSHHIQRLGSVNLTQKHLGKAYLLCTTCMH